MLCEGDIVNLDVSCYLEGVHADLNETVFVGKPSKATVRLVHCAYECLAEAIALCRPGCFYRNLGEVITRRAEKEGCSVVRTYCGHGVGEQFHCAPNVPHYANNKAVGVMTPGHVFTIEPMINQGVWRDVTWPDNWTSTTKDGKWSAQFEHTLLITENGVEILTETEEPYYRKQLREMGIDLP